MADLRYRQAIMMMDVKGAKVSYKSTGRIHQ